MSEQRNGYMAELDRWSDKYVIAPLYDALMHGPEEVIVGTKQLVRKAIRAKVLESYINGQSAAPRPAGRRSHGR